MKNICGLNFALLLWPLVAAVVIFTIYMGLAPPNGIEKGFSPATDGHIWKINHFVAFLTIGGLLLVTLRNNFSFSPREKVGMRGKTLSKLTCLVVVIFCAALGAGIEIAQSLTPEHTPRFTDWYIDMSGTILGIIAILTISKIFEGRKKL